jgi:hypothetical protein
MFKLVLKTAVQYMTETKIAFQKHAIKDTRLCSLIDKLITLEKSFKHNLPMEEKINIHNEFKRLNVYISSRTETLWSKDIII